MTLQSDFCKLRQRDALLADCFAAMEDIAGERELRTCCPKCNECFNVPFTVLTNDLADARSRCLALWRALDGTLPENTA